MILSLCLCASPLPHKFTCFWGLKLLLGAKLYCILYEVILLCTSSTALCVHSNFVFGMQLGSDNILYPLFLYKLSYTSLNPPPPTP